jgi:hypothetical protein
MKLQISDSWDLLVYFYYIPVHEYLHILLQALKLAEYLTLPGEDHKPYHKVSVNEETYVNSYQKLFT